MVWTLLEAWSGLTIVSRRSISRGCIPGDYQENVLDLESLRQIIMCFVVDANVSEKG